MSADNRDRALVVFTDSQDPVALARLKALVDARTNPAPPPSADGPQTYRGIPVPEELRPNWDQVGAVWWRFGVDSALETAVPLLTALADPKSCESTEMGECLTHNYPPPLCADGEACRLIKEARDGDE